MRGTNAPFAAWSRALRATRTLFLVFAVLMAFAASASAQLSYEHEFRIDGSTTPDGSFGEGGPVEIAVNQTSRNLYVVDPQRDVIDVFDPAGQYLCQITGATTPSATECNGPTGSATPAGGLSISALAIDNSVGVNAGSIYVGGGEDDVVHIFSPTGAYVGELTGSSTPAGSFSFPAGIAVDAAGAVYVADRDNLVVDKFVPSGGPVEEGDFSFQFTDAELGTPGRLAVDAFDNLYNAAGSVKKFNSAGAFQGMFGGGMSNYFSTDVEADRSASEMFIAAVYEVLIVDPAGNTKAIIPGGASGAVEVDETSGQVYVSSGGYGVDYYKRQDLPDPVTGPVVDFTDISAVIEGQIGRAEGGPVTSCAIEYGSDQSYGRSTPCDQPTPYTDMTTDVSATLTNLVPGTPYHYRLASRNEDGTSYGEDRTFKTAQPPTIEAFSTRNVLETSADLVARIHPQDLPTTYRFEYGQTPSYGTSIPIPDGQISPSSNPVEVVAHVTGLSSATYHFRVVASNAYGTTVTSNQTFDFLPPNCPNAHVRQEVAANYLPDCRAFELVSPEDANGTVFFPAGGPTSGEATNPSRVSYTGLIATPVGAGDPTNTYGDLYVSTRTTQGWKTRYVGRPSNEALFMGGPPETEEAPDKAHRGVLTDPEMSRFIQWDSGVNLYLSDPDQRHPASTAPYISNYEGEVVDRWPTDLEDVPGGEAGLACESLIVSYVCKGVNTASSDLSHFVFSIQGFSYLPEGKSAAPGSAYDNNTETGAVSLISLTPEGHHLPQQAGGRPDEFIRFPAVSEDGSRILMSTELGDGVHLYMRAGGAITYDITKTHPSRFAGMTSDGSKVYFTTAGKVTADDHDTSEDLYLWETASNTYTRISKGSAGAGDTDNCSPSWSSQCGIGIVSFGGWSKQQSGQGGNGTSDQTVAPENGDIYFYSPEQLDGGRGLRNFQNLYLYRDGTVRHVATLDPGPYCVTDTSPFETPYCSDGPVLRMQISPNNDHMAFMTATRLTAYDNAGHSQMYSYEPDSRKLICVSCIPDGTSPTSEVWASQNGLFMTDDGRTFFSTNDALVPYDTNRLNDVYEYVDGKARLITTGIGDQNVDEGGYGIVMLESRPGLIGISADGRDVYFATYDRLVPQDRNGATMKVYNARTGGGFPFRPNLASCAAADECHGPSSRAPEFPEIGTSAELGDGGGHPARAAKPRCKRRNAKGAGCKRKAQKKRSGRGGRGRGSR